MHIIKKERGQLSVVSHLALRCPCPDSPGSPHSWLAKGPQHPRVAAPQLILSERSLIVVPEDPLDMLECFLVPLYWLLVERHAPVLCGHNKHQQSYRRQENGFQKHLRCLLLW